MNSIKTNLQQVIVYYFFKRSLLTVKIKECTKMKHIDVEFHYQELQTHSRVCAKTVKRRELYVCISMDSYQDSFLKMWG